MEMLFDISKGRFSSLVSYGEKIQQEFRTKQFLWKCGRNVSLQHLCYWLSDFLYIWLQYLNM